ncbi:3'-5' exonuclease [Acetobacter orleanensis]|uniref:DNA polymerase III subunit epsilon n=1 Tax=Acetobacter orleanensis TaxID=104099 RepID=A0A4Y3TRX5_9PROT|nr:3'-5' exonuclease [Acetobacter orleanensis]KXV66333.1 DNA polymerase III subunit epsilon [Acetobacter orleanensis]PCD78543.1 3'-5' exonuclease [Acetobacter orleanensis]GAN69173.1 DNA polymerase III subunit epsilon [Acetobacter orleanensis JCM 7639]GBR29372.1 DNA polymerase III subunit epsilon and related 3'-5' exonuclease [Acetobacter orleanensis NRIC 0473]GEB83760.1 DNA polymerase III subunit epsilon [Acetobacter orleanensis]
MSLENLARTLEHSGDYRVLRRLQSHWLEGMPEGRRVRKGLFLDLETTGLDPALDEIIEIGMVPFAFTLEGRLLGVLPAFSRLREPSVPVPARVTELTGLTQEQLAGHSIAPEDVADFAADASLVIAHNAAFDRPFIEAFCPAFAQKPWACSMADVPWENAGFEGRKLGYLATQAGFFFEGHRATDDCLASLALLGYGGFPEGRTALSYLLDRARAVWVRVWATQAPFESKDALKARGYRWNDGMDGRPKAWFIDLPPEKREEEEAFLRDEIYRRDVDLTVSEIKATDRFTSRV